MTLQTHINVNDMTAHQTQGNAHKNWVWALDCRRTAVHQDAECPTMVQVQLVFFLPGAARIRLDP